MSQLIINPTSAATLSRLMEDLPQSLLLTGPVGIGLGTVAQFIADTLGDSSFTVLPEKKDKLDLIDGSITVSSIRQLFDQTRSIHVGKLIIIIDYAERMGIPAQNAFLKLLEEPSAGTYFIVVTHTASKLLPTVTSRLQSLELRPITRDQSEALLDALAVTDATKRRQLLFMAEGRPAELTRLIADDDYFQSRAAIVRDARDLLQASTYQKLRVAHKYKDDRLGALTLVGDACAILRRSISDKPALRPIARIDALLLAHDRIQANGNVRLCLARLVV